MNLSNLFSSVIGAVTVGLLDFLFWGRQGKLEDRVSKLETEKVDKLSAKFDKHLEADQSQRILALLEQVSGRMAKMEDSLQRALENNAGQDQRISNLALYTQNLDKALQNHEKNYHHRGN